MQHTAATVAGLLTVALLLPIVSSFPQLNREVDITPDTVDDEIGPRHMVGSWRGNELWHDRWRPRDWRRPPFFRPAGWPPGPPPPQSPPLDLDRPFIPFGDAQPSARPSNAPRQPSPPQLDMERPFIPFEDVQPSTRPSTAPQQTSPAQRDLNSPFIPFGDAQASARPPTTPPPSQSPPLDLDRPFIPVEDAQPSTNPSTTTTTTAIPDGSTTREGCNCPTTSEFNPVCGTDMVSYPNPGRLHCARDCGKSVEIYHMGNCVTTSTAQPRGAGS